MTTDSTLLRELGSLQEELAASSQKRASHPADRAPPKEKTITRSTAPDNGTEGEQLRGEICNGVKMNGEFLEEAEKKVSAGSTRNVISAMVAGILVGRLLGRRWGLRHDQ